VTLREVQRQAPQSIKPQRPAHRAIDARRT
jgi:hypothetical protein